MGVLLTLFQPDGADYAHHITARTPGFENLTTSLYSFPKVLDGSAKALMIIFVAWMHFVNFQTKLKESHEIRLGTNMLRNYDRPVY